MTEVIRLPKQDKNDDGYIRYVNHLRNEIAKFSRQGKIDLPEFLRMMKGNAIPQDQIDFLLTDEELYVMTNKRYFRYSSGVNDKLSTKEEFKYWLVNQMKLDFTEQDYEIFWTATMNN